MSQNAITVENLSKAYRIGLKDEIPDTIMGAATGWLKSPLRNFRQLRRLNTFSKNGRHDHSEEDTLWALKDISFDVPEGEVLGVIGRNGAGKSTLLKVLSRITEPTSGRAIIRGRVSSLLEVGTGFHPELTGRENVYLNGTILGMSKREIDRKFDEIVEFSGVEKFLDTPVKRYSSGMKVRLAFAVAAHLEPEILIIDEVLAVGDQEFQNKCLGKMNDVATSGRTVLFVSHNMPAVETLCSSAILLGSGRIESSGAVQDIVGQYLSSTSDGAAAGLYQAPPTSPLREVRLVSQDSQDATDTVACGQVAAIQMVIEPDTPIADPAMRLVVFNQNGQRIFTCNSRFQFRRMSTTGTKLELRCQFDELRLCPGNYTLSATLLSAGQEVATADPAIRFKVAPGDVYGTGRLPQQAGKGIYFPHVTWSIDGSAGSSSSRSGSLHADALFEVS